MIDLISIHTELCCRLFRLGFPLVRLWEAIEVDGKKRCLCRKGKDCKNPGKHIEQRTMRASVIRSEAELQRHIESGGNVGLVLYSLQEGVPPSPLRLAVWDMDDEAGPQWLDDKAIQSPWVVTGSVGCHLYSILDDSVPDLVTRYNPFKPNAPKMDLKTSGLMVLPMANGKRLSIDGEVLTPYNLHLLDRFNSLDSLRVWLPKVDPRVLIPKMKERVLDPDQANGAPRGKRAKTKKITRLSMTEPRRESFNSNYHEIPYYERKRLAHSHAERVKPSIQSEDPWKCLVKLVTDCILNYGLSDQDTWLVIKESFNPRCRTDTGKKYPWKKAHVATAIGWAHEEGAFTTMAKLGHLADPARSLARLKRQGDAANQRKSKKRACARSRDYETIERLCVELGHVSDHPFGTGTMPVGDLDAGALRFPDLYADIAKLCVIHDISPFKEKRVGQWLKSIGFTTDKDQRVRRVPIDQYTATHTTHATAVPPLTQCSIPLLGSAELPRWSTNRPQATSSGKSRMVGEVPLLFFQSIARMRRTPSPPLVDSFHLKTSETLWLVGATGWAC